MEITSILSLLGVCGALAAGAYWLTSKGDKKTAGREEASGILQKIGLQKVKDTEEKQKVVVAEIDKNEKLSEESKTKIKDIQKKAATEINTILKEESIAKIGEDIDKSWDEL